MMKRLGALLLLMLVLLVGCSGGSYTITIGEINAFENRITGEYNQFSGEFFKNVTVGDSEVIEVTLTAHTEAGEIKAIVLDSDGKEVSTLNPGDTIQIQEAGEYKLQVEGKKHKGSVLLSWEPL
ncbi:hypothetical protein [Niallia oryzisoli]|uniref:hypothetical protein n=1 Tax=Niallia oryzisoli TaxID=1737571 RepID=UPI003734EE04